MMPKGLRTLLTGVAFLVLAIMALVAAFKPMVRGESSEQQFRVPGTFQVSTTEPGRYFLWDNTRTVIDGARFKTTDKFPETLVVTVTDAEGTHYPLDDSTSLSWSVGNHRKQSIGHVDLSGPAEMQVSIEGEGGLRVVSFSQSTLLNNLGHFFRRLAVAGVCGLLGVIGIIWGAVKLMRRAPSSQPPPLP